jgi:DNA-binding NarL/FixJ family response regulator
VKTIHVVMADPQTLVRAGLCALLNALAGVQVVAEAGDGHSALALLKAHQPDLALLDVGLPGPSAAQLAACTTRVCPAVPVLLVAAEMDETSLLKALRAGAAGYLLKDAPIAELERAVRSVAGGELYFGPAVSQHLRAAARRPIPGGKDGRLTSRQGQVLQLMAEGRSTKQIAAALQLSAKTVETHRAHIMRRLGIRNLAGLVRYALGNGFVHPEE